MKLVVRVIEARNIPAMDPNGYSDPFVRLKLGRQRFKTKVVKKSLTPSWCEEFSFKVEDLKEELVVSVFDEDKYCKDDFVGLANIPVSRVLDADGKSLGTAWYTLQPKNNKSKITDCGEILLTIRFLQNSPFTDEQDLDLAPSRNSTDTAYESPSRSFSTSSSPNRLEEVAPFKEEKSQMQNFVSRVAQLFNRNVEYTPTTSEIMEIPEIPKIATTEVFVDSFVESSSASFSDAMKSLELRYQENDMPNNLPGGVIIDQLYALASPEMNSLLFSPESNLLRSLADIQRNTELQLGPWKFEDDGSLRRVISYTKAASKLIKALKATEEQTYLKADSKGFAVLSSASTPDAPYGSSFRVEVLYCITPGPELPSGELSSRVVISWRMNFLQSTMMRGMIENGARQGVRESVEQHAALLAQNARLVDPMDIASDKEQVLASLQVEPQSDWKLGIQYFANFTTISTIFMGFYLLLHLCLTMSNTVQGLEFVGLDLPDSVGEVIACVILVLQGQRVLALVSRFMHARVKRGSDHGVKAQGEGWLLTVALLEGNNLATVESTGFSDVYVVFSCNGRTKTSSIKFQKSDPLWNEIFEFDAMDEPPSTLEVDVYDFDGPFDEAISLGHAEINFVKSNISELADVWIPLQGKLAQTCQSRLHLRIFLNDTRGSNAVKEYLTKMEKEVGKKIKLRSPQTNSAFQKLFKLPSEEFLINDFTCQLKRKMPLQGRLFLSSRIIGFHADLFGRKTTFFFLWEDIETIQVVPPTLSSMGSPIIVITLRPGKGLDAKHGAKLQDSEGRLKFHFQSFVSFSVANRTIMALWKARALSPEQKVQIVDEENKTSSLLVEEEPADKSMDVSEEESDTRSLQSEESGSFLGFVDVDTPMSVVYSSVLSVPTAYVMEIFGGGDLDERVMERAGCLNYSHTPWENEKLDVFMRQVYYKFNKGITRHRGEVTSTQQKTRLLDRKGWLIEEIMTLHGVPLGDYFNLNLRYQLEDLPSRSMGCNVQVYIGVAWLKSTKYKNRITKNILTTLQGRLTVMFSTVEKEFVSGM
ncbi:hypothetical protein AgCh_022362 [Apium graveolens]